MNRLIIIITLLSINFSVFSQTSKMLSFDKDWQIVSQNNKTVFKCDCFVDDRDKLIGPFECTDLESGQIVKKYNFSNNILHGKITEYYTDGTLKLEAEYNNGLPINEWKEYDENGRLKLHRVFDEESRVTQDYFQNNTPYEKALAEYEGKKEEPPIYETKCMSLKIDQQKYDCSEEAILNYLANPPIPPFYKNDPAFVGKTIECLFQFRINKDGIVDEVKIIKSTGDEFLDELVDAHVLNMLPFESAKQQGIPIHYWKDAQIIFKF